MKLTYGAALLATVALAAGCSPSKKDLATVNGQKITDEQLSAYMMQGPEAKAAMRNLIQETILNDAAAKQGIKVTDAEVDQYLQARRDQYPPNRLDDAYAAAGATPARMRREAKANLIRRAIEMAGAKVSDESVKKMYDADANGLFTKPDWIQIGVLITKDRPDADKAASAFKQGADFTVVSGKFAAPGTQPKGDQFQWIGVLKNQLISEQRQPMQGLAPALKAALTKTKEGSLSAPIGTPGRPGQTMIYVKKRVAGGKIPLDEVKSEIAYGIAVQNSQAKMDAYPELVTKAKVEIASDQFKDLSKPEALLPTAPQGAPRG